MATTADEEFIFQIGSKKHGYKYKLMQPEREAGGAYVYKCCRGTPDAEDKSHVLYLAKYKDGHWVAGLASPDLAAHDELDFLPKFRTETKDDVRALGVLEHVCTCFRPA